MRKSLLLVIFAFYGFCSLTLFAQSQNLSIPNPKSLITKEQLIRDKDAMKKYHPNPFNSFPESQWDSLINVVAKDLPLFPILETEKTLIRRKLLDRITYEDPHVRFLPILGKKGSLKLKMKNVKALPFTLINISDTLIIDQSFNENIIIGDRILSINDVDVKKYLESSYRDRYMSGYCLQTFHHFCFSNNYKIKLIRNNKPVTLNIEGMPIKKDFFLKMDGEIEEKVFGQTRIGYFKINNFDYNIYLIKRLARFLDRVRKSGCRDVIIDIRKNPGGNGDRFDELISLFTNKVKIPYQYGVKLKVSEATYKDYKYSKKDFGKIVDLPDSLFISESPLDNSKYKGDFNYYFLVSQQTASMAATFANVMQYNKIGLLVGEPLSRNALNYGETIIAERDNSFLTISTVENFEYTNAVNGILYPDIAISYVAKEYMCGGDPVLEKCIEYIRTKQK